MPLPAQWVNDHETSGIFREIGAGACSRFEAFAVLSRESVSGTIYWTCFGVRLSPPAQWTFTLQAVRARGVTVGNGGRKLVSSHEGQIQSLEFWKADNIWAYLSLKRGSDKVERVGITLTGTPFPAHVAQWVGARCEHHDERAALRAPFQILSLADL